MGVCVNLRAEMARNGISVADLAAAVGKSDRTIRNKIYGRCDFSWLEVQKIHEIFPDIPISDLFFRKSIA